MGMVLMVPQVCRPSALAAQRGALHAVRADFLLLALPLAARLLAAKAKTS
jgi:hypothetical protein